MPRDLFEEAGIESGPKDLLADIQPESIETIGFSGPIRAPVKQAPMGQEVFGKAVDYVTGKGAEDIPEIPSAPSILGPTDPVYFARTPEGQLNILKKRYPNAKIDGSDKEGNPIFVLGEKFNAFGTDYPEDQRFYLNKPGLSFQDIESTKAGIAKAFLPVAAGVSTGGMGWLTAAPFMFASGSAGEAINQAEANRARANEGYDVTEMLKVGGLSVVGDMAGRALSSILGRIFGSAASKMVKENGQLTDDAIRALSDAGISPENLTQAFKSELQAQLAKGLPSDDAVRATAFKTVGAKPTTGQITRDFVQQQLEAESAKSVNPLVGNPIRNRLAETNRAITGYADELLSGTGGTADDLVAGSAVKQSLRSKQTEMQKAASNLYETAKNAKGVNSPLPKEAQDNFFQKVVPVLDDFEGSIPPAVTKRLEQFGLFGNTKRDITIGESEKFRQLLNEYADADPVVAKAVGKIKGILDESVDMLSSGYDDAAKAFQIARSASKAKHAEFSQKDIVEAVVSKKAQFTDVVPDEQVVRKVVFSGSVDDLFKVRKSLTTGTESQIVRGSEAWNNIRATTFKRLMDSAMNPNVKNELGDVIFSGAKFQTELQKIGSKKLSLLFSPKEIEQIQSIRLVADSVTNKVPGSLNTSNTASALLNDAFKRLPFAGSVTDYFVDIGKRAAVKRALSGSTVTEAGRKAQMGSRVLPKAGTAAAVYEDR